MVARLFCPSGAIRRADAAMCSPPAGGAAARIRCARLAIGSRQYAKRWAPAGGVPPIPPRGAVDSSLSYAGAALTRATIDAQGEASPSTIIHKYDRFGFHAVSAKSSLQL